MQPSCLILLAFACLKLGGNMWAFSVWQVAQTPLQWSIDTTVINSPKSADWRPAHHVLILKRSCWQMSGAGMLICIPYFCCIILRLPSIFSSHPSSHHSPPDSNRLTSVTATIKSHAPPSNCAYHIKPSCGSAPVGRWDIKLLFGFRPGTIYH